MKIINLILDILLILLSYFVPKNKKIILCGAGHGCSFIGNPKYFYLYLVENKKYFSPFWITENKKLFSKLLDKGLPVLYKYSFKGFKNILRSKYLVIEQMPKDILYFGYTGLGRLNYIQTFHGIAFKKIGNDAGYEGKGIAKVNLFASRFIEVFATWLKTILKSNILYKKYKLIIASSEEIKKIIESAFATDKIEILGYPRNDIFFNTNLQFTNYKKELGLGKYKKIICYVPTYRDNYNDVVPFSEEFYSILNKYFKEEQFLLIIKKHPYEKNIQVPDNLTNIQDFSEDVDDLQELLIYVDIVITDYSSVFMEYNLTDRPIIYYSYDYEEYLQNCRGMYYDYYDELPGPFAENEDELFELLKNVDRWFGDENYQNKYIEFKNKFNYFLDGNSSKRLMEYLLAVNNKVKK